MKVKKCLSFTYENLFYISLGIYLSLGILSSSLYGQYVSFEAHTILLSCAFLCLLIYEIREGRLVKYQRLDYIALVVALILEALASVQLDMLQSLTIFGLFFCARRMDFRKIARFILVLTSAFLLFIILSSYAGIISNHIFIQGTRQREGCGFRYVLYPQMYLFSITALWTWLKKETISWKSILLLAALNTLLYLKTDARLSFACALLFLLFAIIGKCKPGILSRLTILWKGACVSFPILTVLSLIFSYTYQTSISWMAELNHLLGGRISLAHSMLMERKIGLLGQELLMNGSGLGIAGIGAGSDVKYDYVDNLYVQMLLKYGILFTVIVLILITIALLKCLKMKDYYLLFFFLLTAVRSLIDDLSIYVRYTPFWLIIGILLFGTVYHVFSNNILTMNNCQ